MSDYSHNDELPPLNDESRAELTSAFNIWFGHLLFTDGCSSLERDVLRNQRQNLLEEWLRVRPVLTKADADILNGKKK